MENSKTILKMHIVYLKTKKLLKKFPRGYNTVKC